MEQLALDQVMPQLVRAQRTLIALPEGFLHEDHVASALGLKLLLEKMDKHVQVLTVGKIPEHLSFLPGGQPQFPSALPEHRPLEVVLSTEKIKLGELSYQVEDNAVHIFLTPKSGEFQKEDITVRQVAFGFDLIITLGSQSLEQLSRVYQDNAEWFYDIPKLNIDNNPANEYFGTMNLVQVTAVSISEILTEIFLKDAHDMVDEGIATCLLTGIISATHSFQHPKTTPKSMLKAADLIDLGARQQDIIINLYKTKDFALLKLWGRALARVKGTLDRKLLYATLPAQDFNKTETSGKELPDVMREMLDNISDYQSIALLAEVVEGDIHLVIAGVPHVSLEAILEELGATAQSTAFLHNNYRVLIAVIRATDLTAAEDKLVKAIEKIV